RGGGELQADKEYSNVSQRLFCSLLCIGTGRLRDSGDNLPHCRLRYYLCRPCADQDREENNRYCKHRDRSECRGKILLMNRRGRYLLLLVVVSAALRFSSCGANHYRRKASLAAKETDTI